MYIRIPMVKKDWPCYKDGKKGLWDGDFGWISVSEAYSYMKDKGHHFYPAGRYKETYIDAYKLNETFGDCTVFKQKKRVLSFLNTLFELHRIRRSEPSNPVNYFMLSYCL